MQHRTGRNWRLIDPRILSSVEVRASSSGAEVQLPKHVELHSILGPKKYGGDEQRRSVAYSYKIRGCIQGQWVDHHHFLPVPHTSEHQSYFQRHNIGLSLWPLWSTAAHVIVNAEWAEQS